LQQKVEEDRRRKQAATQAVTKVPETRAMQQLIVTQPEESTKPNRNVSDNTIASLFNTNRTYVSEARKLKETKPEAF